MAKGLFTVSGIDYETLTVPDGTQEKVFRSIELRGRGFLSFGFEYEFEDVSDFEVRFRFWTGKNWTAYFIAATSDFDPRRLFEQSVAATGIAWFNMADQHGWLDGMEKLEVSINRPSETTTGDIDFTSGYFV